MGVLLFEILDEVSSWLHTRDAYFERFAQCYNCEMKVELVKLNDQVVHFSAKMKKRSERMDELIVKVNDF